MWTRRIFSSLSTACVLSSCRTAIQQTSYCLQVALYRRSASVSTEDLGHAVLCLRAPLDGVSLQLFRHDLLSAVGGMLLLRQLYWNDRHAPLALGSYCDLNSLLDQAGTNYSYEAVDSLGSSLDLAILRVGRPCRGSSPRCAASLSHRQARRRRRYQTLRFAENLRRLELIDTSITDAGMPNVEGLTAMEELTLAGASITNEGLKSISGLSEVRILSLRDNKITGQGMRPHREPCQA